MSKSTTTKNKSRRKKAVKKIPYQFKPEGLDLKMWQILLRKQAAREERFIVKSVDEKNYPGEYQVDNPANAQQYKVVYRGAKSPWNYCSCMDFKTSHLGTCKHLEAVKLWIRKGHHVHREIPAYTSVYLDYTGARKVRIRIGSDHDKEYRTLAAEYFNKDLVLNADAYRHFDTFLKKAYAIEDTFRCYKDALQFVLEYREKVERTQWVDLMKESDFSRLVRTRLYPYQEDGIRFAAKTGRAIIADEMGLGKTIQAVGTAELMRKRGLSDSTLILCPTSLKYQWKREIERFTGQGVHVIEGDYLKRRDQYRLPVHYKIVSYNTACNDIKALGKLETDMLIIDEVQRLKNWNTQIARAARKIVSRYSVILSGTPLENRLEELYSVVELVDQFGLGPYYLFRDRYIISDDKGATIGYRHLNEIRLKLKDILIRRKKSDVHLQLPERQDKNLMMPMTKEQMAVHDDAKSGVSQLLHKWETKHFLSETDRNRLLLLLQQMRMVCDSTYILDQKTRYDTKVDEVMNIIRNVVEGSDEKVVVFSQWERMTRLIAKEMEEGGIHYEYLHGGVPSKDRKDLVNHFMDLTDSRVFLSTDAGSTGLNLQVASIVINVDLPWNPAVLEQRIARIYRIGQKKNIQVINLVAADTFEESMLGKLQFKSSMFEGALDGGQDTIFSSDGKFQTIMKDLSDTLQDTEETVANEEQPVDTTDKEPVAAPPAEEKKEQPVQPASQASSVSAESKSSSDQLVEQGAAFFSGLAKTLKSAESTKALVDSIIEKDPDTGQVNLKIPVPDKETVVEVLGLIGKLFGAKQGSGK
ncbi:MAG: DEAD/DEAH box helicase [Prevotella sp.]|jgi:hypothetical protein|nr:DEAD/DEAH box helicase [Prevotella sp.]MCH3995353.1 DEAD/DEAH box helicase [Prevotella sp.]